MIVRWEMPHDFFWGSVISKSQRLQNVLGTPSVKTWLSIDLGESHKANIQHVVRLGKAGEASRKSNPDEETGRRDRKEKVQLRLII